MKELTTLTNVMEMAIAIKNPIRVKHINQPIVTFAPTIDVEDGCYEVNNSVISFVEDGTLYVIPYFRAVIETLRNCGFVNTPLYVPFSNGDYPVDMEMQWNNLLAEARKQRSVDFVSDCERISDEAGYRPLSEELLSKCFEMPVSGVQVKHPCWDATFYPEITGECIDCTVADKLGHYNTNNGVCVFVYRNGKTYVTRNWDVVQALRENGYREKGLHVPFSNLETILDASYAKQWASISA